MLTHQFVAQSDPVTPQATLASHRWRHDDELQAHLLQGVSRTFALTIPQLPPPLFRVVSNAYLLCRIVDTVEDESALSVDRKHYFCTQFTAVVNGSVSAKQFADELQPLLSNNTIAAEHELIRHTPEVVDILFNLNRRQQNAIITCISTMSKGMADFQQQAANSGLKGIKELDQYCYYVAGVVGEMLTELFCEYSPEIEAHGEALMKLAVSFGQGLQMTNILKDIWDDFDHGACWLPQDVFTQTGFDLHDLAPDHYQKTFGEGLKRLIVISTEHLSHALDYTLLIPKQETGIRNFCLWSIGMAILTLRKIHHHLDFSSGNEVKISHNSVKATIITSRLSATHDSLLRTLFHLGQIGMPWHTSIRGAYPGAIQAGQQVQRTGSGSRL